MQPAQRGRQLLDQMASGPSPATSNCPCSMSDDRLEHINFQQICWFLLGFFCNEFRIAHKARMLKVIGRALDAIAISALEEARSLSARAERTEALKRAGQLRNAADPYRRVFSSETPSADRS